MTPIPVITGPTAVGKTALSLELAARSGAEIVSFDSRQFYRGMDIGTAKPTDEERSNVPHHFIDDLDPGEGMSAGEYARRAWQRIDELMQSGTGVVCVGGSTLYLKALTEGIADLPDVSAATRRHVQDRLDTDGPAALFAELERVDPAAASTMDATKSQRIVRALEVHHETGLPLSYFHQRHVRPPFQFRVVVLYRERDELYRRIEHRVDEMLEAGLLDEVRRLLDAGVPPDAQAMRTIGYREPMQYLRGEIDFDEMRRLIKRNTRRYAKRQLTWFRGNERNTWLPATSSLSELAEALESDVQMPRS